MTQIRRLLLAVLTCLALAATMLASTPAEAAKPQAKINSVGDRFPGGAIPIVGYLSGTGTKNDKTLKLQHAVGGKWKNVAKKTKQDDGKFKFPSQADDKLGVSKWRVVVKRDGKTLDVSKALKVKVIAPTCAAQPGPTTCPKPPDFVETQIVDSGPPVCDPAGGGTVPIANQTRRTTYVWNPTALGWVLGTPGPWTTTSTGTRPASPDECTGGTAFHPGLPDLQIRNLNSCSDAEDTNPDPDVDNCFRIQHVDENGVDHKLLKFPAVTANFGPGDARVEATRPNTTTAWSARQVIYAADGTTTSTAIPAMEFIWGGDEHSHWHIKDFDSYQIRSADGTVLTIGEKHGFCLEDNTNLPNVTYDPIYTHDRVCGVNQPDALSILHGLSAGWGDTYPSHLPDQAIDVTGLPDGVYTVRVEADALGLIMETNNANNATTQQVSIVGDTVTPVG